jgi:hypothetical protein
MRVEQRAQTWFGIGRLAALLALFGMLLAGVAPLPAQAMTPDGPGGAAICHMGDAAPDQPSSGHHHDGMCPSCCLFHCVHAHIAIPTPVCPVPVPPVAVTRVPHGAMGARAPPAQAEDAPYPRGPPLLA